MKWFGAFVIRLPLRNLEKMPILDHHSSQNKILMKPICKMFAVAIVALILPLLVSAQTWMRDQVHSTAMYTIRHAVTPMIGIFRSFEVKMDFDPNAPLHATVNATIQVNSVLMGSAGLGEHLHGEDFFDAVTFPQWTFASTKIIQQKGGKTHNQFVDQGKLTAQGVTKDVEIPFEFLGTRECQRGSKAGFTAEFTINRLEYGIGEERNGGIGNDLKIKVMLDMNSKM